MRGYGTFPPTLTISEWIGQLKGGTSYEVNPQTGVKQMLLEWQTGYGVVSFGTKDLPWVRAYIQNQREHTEGQQPTSGWSESHMTTRKPDEDLAGPPTCGVRVRRG